MKIINWLVENKEWLFSGIGVTCLLVAARILFRRQKDKNDHESKTIIKQTDNGTNNTQIGIQHNYYNYKETDDE